MAGEGVVLGFSGGIDSTAAVDILRSEGYSVSALTLDMCGNSAMVEKARAKAADLGVDFCSLNVTEHFKESVVSYFVNEYLSGRTPAPCTRCNSHIKWHHLMEYADSIGAYHVATGHYFRRVEYNNHLYVARPADRAKDQSYYLWGLTSKVLTRAVTPMAEMIKREVMQYSDQKRESMGVCFLEGRNYGDFLRQQCGELPRGEVLNLKGEVVGEHAGVAFYTLCQKRGEGIPSGSAVVRIDAARNRLYVGDNDALNTMSLDIHSCNVIDRDELFDAQDITVMVRGIGRNPQQSVRVTSGANDTLHIELSDPAWAVASGQPIVLYRGDRVIGGGYNL